MRLLGGINLAVAAIAVFASCAAWLAGAHLQQWFARYFGSMPPAICVAALGVVAILVVPHLKRHGFWGAPRVDAVLVAPSLVVGFAAFIIAVDSLAGLSSDLNAPLPWALLYYPAMGFAAQVALHLAPLVAILWSAPAFSQRRPWAVMTIAAAPEAALQALNAEGATASLVALHVLAFGVVEIYLLRQFGFAVMYAFRLGYYLLWHILWAVVRGG